jgi:hemoglobin-like flavoprotein
VSEGKLAARLFHMPYDGGIIWLNPQSKRLVQESWRQVAPIADAAAEMFYQRLFEIDPPTRKLFHPSRMAVQRGKVVQALTLAIEGLDDLDALLPTVRDLGRRHLAYGVDDKHYESVGEALLWTLQQGLGAAWTPALASAWTEVYVLLSDAMREAAQAAREAAVHDAHAVAA